MTRRRSALAAAVLSATTLLGCVSCSTSSAPAAPPSTTAAGHASSGSAAPSSAGSVASSVRAIRLRSAAGQPELLLRPAGRVTGLVVYMHGLQQNQNQLLDNAQLFPVRDALLAAGYAIIASEAHGNNAGNPASVRDQIDAVHDARARLGNVRRVDILAFSMGGLDALLTAASRKVAGLHAVALLSGAVDQLAFVSGPYAKVIGAAFGYPSESRVPALARHSDPLVVQSDDYRGYAYHFWQSPDDHTVAPAQTAEMIAHLATAGVTARATPLTGDHGDLSALRPHDVLSFFAT